VKDGVIADDLAVKQMRKPLQTMGNICSTTNNNKVSGKPPRDLAGLVEEILLYNSKGEPSQSSIWGDHFRQFLRHRGQTDLENALDFVTLSTKLQQVQEEAKTPNNKKNNQELKQDRVSLLQQMGERYFKVESKTNVPLSNQVLHEELQEKLSKISLKSSEKEIEEAYLLVNQAKTDNRVWKAGLDSSYKTFLANKPSPTVKAVLLSIL